eukprot:3136856-Pleurochrysis_carterae.AAC.4
MYPSGRVRTHGTSAVAIECACAPKHWARVDLQGASRSDSNERPYDAGGRKRGERILFDSLQGKAREIASAYREAFEREGSAQQSDEMKGGIASCICYVGVAQ